jgi:type I restriction enzyme, S subunit
MNEKQNIKQLPKGWKRVNLGEVCDEIFAGGDVPKNNFSHTYCEDFQIPIFANGERNKGLYGYTNIAKVQKLSITISARGTIGLAEIRNKPFFPIVRLIVLIPSQNLDVSFLKYAIDNCKIKHTGSSIPQLTVPTVKTLSISHPSVPTQQAIVSKIEELFSELDKGIENLRIAQQQLKTYRQSVLKCAFEEKLTNENVKDGELPIGWKQVLIKDVTEINPKIPNRDNISKEMEVQFLPMK